MKFSVYSEIDYGWERTEFDNIWLIEEEAMLHFDLVCGGYASLDYKKMRTIFGATLLLENVLFHKSLIAAFAKTRVDSYAEQYASATEINLYAGYGTPDEYLNVDDRRILQACVDKWKFMSPDVAADIIIRHGYSKMNRWTVSETIRAPKIVKELIHRNDFDCAIGYADRKGVLNLIPESLILQAIDSSPKIINSKALGVYLAHYLLVNKRFPDWFVKRGTAWKRADLYVRYYNRALGTSNRWDYIRKRLWQ